MAKISADRKKRALKPDTPDKIKNILRDISLGSPYKIACEANGLSEVHFYNWVKQGTLDLEANNETPQADMVKSLRALEQKEMHRCVALIASAEKGHRGSEWLLERRYWKYFGANVSVVELASEMDEMKRLLAEQKK